MVVRPIQLSPSKVASIGRSLSPVASERAESVPTPPTPVVLVIEDDDSSRDVLARFVVSLGYEVLQAADGEAAMAHIEARNDIALVLSDVRMPGMSGIDVLKVLRVKRPWTKIVLITGDAGSIDELLASHAIAVLKPYDFDVMGRVIADALGRSATPPL